MSNPELKIIYDSEGRAIVDKEVLDLLLKEQADLVERNHKLLQDYYAEAQQVDIQKDEIAKLKDDLAAMTAYAEMFERGEIGNPDATNTTLIKDKLAQLYTKLEMYEKEPKKSYVEQIMELQQEVKALRNRLHWIWAIGVDYDGCGTVESLKELIDEMVDFTQMTDDQVDDQLKAVKQLQQSVIELSAQKAELISQVQRLQRYDEERDELLHARLSEAAYDKGSKDTADRIYSYLYFLNKDNTENLADKMLEWVKNTFGV
jgi:phage shock protein A